MSVGAPIPPRDVSWYGDPRRHGARCDICPLAGSVVVPHTPPAPGRKVRLALVGEGPGRKEEVLRTPFVGLTGRMLDDELQAAGIDRRDAWVTNAALCAGDSDEDNTRAAECCAPRLLRELAALPAEAPIIAFGKAATRSVLGVNSIILARGFVWEARDLSDALKNVEAALRKATKNEDEKNTRALTLRRETLLERHKLAGRTVLPTLHPTFAFVHSEGWAPIFTLDLNRAARWLRGELTRDMLADKVEKVDTMRELRERKRVFIVTDHPATIEEALSLLGPEVGVDIETVREKPLSPMTVQILCVQISDGDRGIVIGPWDARLHAAILTRFFKGRTLVFHNGFNFDHIALERPGEDVVLTESTIEDTLVAHHTFASHYPQKLDHVVATFLDSGPWKIRYGVRGAEEKGLAPTTGDEADLYEYGATDAFVTVLAWRAMQKDLEPERAVYEHDKELGQQGKLLQVVGFRVDRKRRAYLSEKLKARAAALKGRMRQLSRRPFFAPSKLGDVRRVLFGVLRAPMLNPTKSGLASTSNATLEVIRTGGAGTLRSGPGDVKRTGGPINNETADTRAARFAEALLHWRVATKIKGTYVDSVHLHKDGRAHYNWRPYGTVSGRYSCRLQSCPRWSKAIEDRAREQYLASPGCILLYFDLSQAEARFAANLSGDPNFIETCKSDVHTGNAKILFPDKREILERDAKGKKCPRHAEGGSGSAACNCGKPYRDIAKNAGFAVAYLAEVATVFAYLRSKGFPVELEAVEFMLASLKRSYARYYEYVAENVAFVEKHGYLRTALTGRIRYFGFHPKPQEIANFPIQSGIADVMNTRLLRLQRRIRRDLPSVRVRRASRRPELVAQVHDAAIFDVPRAQAPALTAMIEETWKEPVHVPESIVCREAREFLLPAEIKQGERWSDFG